VASNVDQCENIFCTAASGARSKPTFGNLNRKILANPAVRLHLPSAKRRPARPHNLNRARFTRITKTQINASRARLAKRAIARHTR